MVGVVKVTYPRTLAVRSTATRMRSISTANPYGCKRRAGVPRASRAGFQARPDRRTQRLGRDVVRQGRLSGRAAARQLRVYYHAQGVDVGFDPEYVSIFHDPSRLRARNAVNLLAFQSADWGTPRRTGSGASIRPNFGLELACCMRASTPTPPARIRRPDSRCPARAGVSGQDECTYVARNLEPYRDFTSSCVRCQNSSSDAGAHRSSSRVPMASATAHRRRRARRSARRCCTNSAEGSTSHACTSSARSTTTRT